MVGSPIQGRRRIIVSTTGFSIKMCWCPTNLHFRCSRCHARNIASQCDRDFHAMKVVRGYRLSHAVYGPVRSLYHSLKSWSVIGGAKAVARASRFKFNKRGQILIGVHNEMLPSPRCASAIQVVRPLESIAETQPKLQPALLRLSAMISRAACTRRSCG